MLYIDVCMCTPPCVKELLRGEPRIRGARRTAAAVGRSARLASPHEAMVEVRQGTQLGRI